MTLGAPGHPLECWCEACQAVTDAALAGVQTSNGPHVRELLEELSSDGREVLERAIRALQGGAAMLELFAFAARLAGFERNHWGVGVPDPERPLLLVCLHQHARLVDAMECCLASGWESRPIRTSRGHYSESLTDAGAWLRVLHTEHDTDEHPRVRALLERWAVQRLMGLREGRTLHWRDGSTMEADEDAKTV